MSTAPRPEDPGPVRLRQHRLEPPKGWQAIPMGVKILGAFCLLILIMIPVANQKGWFRSQKVTEVSITDTGYVPGLTLSEDSFDRKSRTIKGIVTNGTEKTMDNVVVTYYIRNNQAAEAGEVAAKVGSLAPHQGAKFETGPVAPDGVEPVLRDITGTPR